MCVCGESEQDPRGHWDRAVDGVDDNVPGLVAVSGQHREKRSFSRYALDLGRWSNAWA